MNHNDNELARKICEANDFDGIFLTDYAYSSAIVGFSADNRAIYSYNKMIDYLVENTDMTIEEAAEWIDYNTIGACAANNSPIIMYDRQDDFS